MHPATKLTGPYDYRIRGDDRVETLDANGVTRLFLNVNNTLAWIEEKVGPMTLVSISPVTAEMGSGDVTVTLTGTGFTQGSQILWNGMLDSGTYVSDTTMTTVVKTDLASIPSVNTLQVKQRDTVSAPQTFEITEAAGEE